MAQLEDEFGDIVSKARYGLGLSVDEVAHRSGLSARDLRAMEQYELTANRSQVNALAKVLGLDADALYHSAASSYVPQIPEMPESIQVVSFTFPPIDSNGYLVHVHETDVTLLIDPGAQPEKILSTLHDRKWRLTAVLVTHGHGDHIGALEDVVQATGATVYGHPAELPPHARIASDQIVPLTVGPERVSEHVKINQTDVEVIYCPGHTTGGVAFKIGDFVFTGDTLFAGSLGRALDGPVYYETLLQSARRLLQCPSRTVLFPGHGPATTVQQEQSFNPFLAGSVA